MVLPAAAAKPGVHLGTKGGAFLESIRQYFKRTDKIYLLLCIFSSTMAVVALASWAAKQGNGFATDEITGAITGIGDYRRALVQAGVAAVIFDVVINMARPILKKKRLLPIAVMLAAFVATRFFAVNIILIILVCGVIGALDMLYLQKKEAEE